MEKIAYSPLNDLSFIYSFQKWYVLGTTDNFIVLKKRRQDDLLSSIPT